VPAAAGIPLTHRGVAGEVRVLSGRTAETAPASATVVVFMGLERLGEVCERLLADGFDVSTPAALVSRGTRPDQEVVVAELGTLAEAARDAPGPALVVVGEVVRLREALRSTAARLAFAG
jgi:siroheme synthase